MRWSEIYRLVWLNLSQNKFKAILTSVGIVVGSATIMMVIAIGTGGKEEVAQQFKNLNAGAVDISYGPSENPGESVSAMSFSIGAGENYGGFSPARGTPPGGGGMFSMEEAGEESRMNRENITLGVSDMEDLQVFVPNVAAATISYTASARAEGGSLESAAYYTVAGVKSNYAEISNLTMAVGEFLTGENEEGREKVCVLGYGAAKEIFGGAYDAYGEVVYLDGRPYVVSGVLDGMGTVASGISPDTAVFIPYDTGIKYLTGEDISPTVTVVAGNVGQVEQMIADIKTVLRDAYPNAEFTVADAGSKMEAASASNETLTLLLIAMAAIVFLVGGIGIMNVLFVSVRERTREIGILKALGCSRKDILLEFLAEAACMSLVGAAVGVLAALAITPLVENFSVRVELSLGGALLSLVFGVATGSLFGFYPAYKASRLVPVAALNEE